MGQSNTGTMKCTGLKRRTPQRRRPRTYEMWQNDPENDWILAFPKSPWTVGRAVAGEDRGPSTRKNSEYFLLSSTAHEYEIATCRYEILPSDPGRQPPPLLLIVGRSTVLYSFVLLPCRSLESRDCTQRSLARVLLIVR